VKVSGGAGTAADPNGIDLGGDFGMKKRTFVVAVIGALALVLATGGLVASNMGFKLNYQLLATGAGSATGDNVVSLPYNRQSGLNNALDLMNDIGFANVGSVARYLEASNTFETYTGRKGSPGANFALASGDAVFVNMNASVDYIIVGSHDPSLAISLDATGVGSATGDNFFSFPYHSTASTALDLMNDIGFASVGSVARYLEASNTLETYTGRKGSPGGNFSLVPGEGYFVNMNSTVSYVPSHY
jgi:hypothetical protein